VKQIVVLSILIILFLIFAPPIFASEPAFSEQEIKSLSLDKNESIYPDSMFYSVKRLKEKLGFILTSGREKKAQYLSNLLRVRFKELIYIENSDKSGFLIEAANRYNANVGQINGNYKNVDNRIKRQVWDYESALAKLRDKHPANSTDWLIFQQVIETTRNLE